MYLDLQNMEKRLIVVVHIVYAYIVHIVYACQCATVAQA